MVHTFRGRWLLAPQLLAVLVLAGCNQGVQPPDVNAGEGEPVVAVPPNIAPATPADPASPDGLRVEGRITDEGVECPALRTADGTLYTLAGAPAWVKPGVEVIVQGSVAEMSICQQGTTIAVDTVERRE